MVDAAKRFAGSNAPLNPDEGVTGAESASATASLADYLSFCETALFAPPQSPAWVSAWSAEVQPDAIFATVNQDGEPVLMLALEVVAMRGCRVARFMGGSHASANFPAWARGTASANPPSLSGLASAVHAARPDIDLLLLERLAPELNGRTNPISKLPGFASPNIALAINLDGGFEAVLSRTNAKRRRKKYRSQMRKFEAIGSVRRSAATTPEETNRMLDAFFQMKRARFRSAGLHDVFAETKVQAFFRRLFAEAVGTPNPQFVLHGLEVAGKLRAITGSSLSHGRITCEFGAIAEDDIAHASPGDFLFFDNIREAADDRLDLYDFGVGDEPYKRLWCDVETHHRDVLLPLTAKGRVLAQGLRIFAATKAWVKNTPLIWATIKRLRRRQAGKMPESNSDD